MLPVIMYPITNTFGLQYSFCIVVAASAFGTIYPVYLILIPAAREQVDPAHSHRHSTLPRGRPMSPYKRASRIIHTAVKRKKSHEEYCTTNHVEGEKEVWPG